MVFRVIILAILFSVSVSSLGKAQDTIILTTHELEPYSYYNEKREFVGLAVEVVRCVMDSLKQPYKINVVPWKRAQFLVQKNAAAGFFAGSQNKFRDSYAVMSAIIAEQKWTWYLLKKSKFSPEDENFKSQALVSSFNGANMQKWLIENGYKTIGDLPRNTEVLLRMLEYERVDAVLVNDQVMATLLKKYGLEKEVKSFVNRDKPLGVYFSKHFLASHEGFVQRFNKNVKGCRAKTQE